MATLSAWGPAGSAQAANRAPVTPAGFRLAGTDPSQSHPIRFWLLGDSVMHDAAPAVTAALDATGEATVVANSTFGGWGLTTQLAWVRDSQQIIETYHPQVVVGTWSWDDTLAGDDPSLYASLLRQALEVWLAPGDGIQLVVLVQFPPVGPNTYIPATTRRIKSWTEVSQEQDEWDHIAQSMVRVFPGHAAYLSTSQVFAPGGRFLTWTRSVTGKWVRIRQLDNAHLCPYGAAEMGQLVIDDLQPMLGLPTPQPGWQDGSWSGDEQFNIGIGGPGACPVDQPPLPGYDGLLVPPLPAQLR
ncbi:MAG: hypothetical protein ACRDVW_03575 [Acidimicrobiales bacterium]